MARRVNSENSKMTEGPGTTKYQAPEAQRNKPYPFVSDIFSLGLILHILLTKTIPDFDDNIEPENFDIPGYSQDIIKLTKQMLQVKPENRPTIKEML